jgi:hypothetical protein
MELIGLEFPIVLFQQFFPVFDDGTQFDLTHVACMTPIVENGI